MRRFIETTLAVAVVIAAFVGWHVSKRWWNTFWEIVDEEERPRMGDY